MDILILWREDGKKLGNMITSNFSKITVDSFFESIGTLRDTDLREDIRSLKVPVLGIYGKNDIIVNPNQSKVLLE